MTDQSTPDLSQFDRVLAGEYIQYYAVNRIDKPIAPFGMTGEPLTLEQAKALYARLKQQHKDTAFCINECKLHISFFTGGDDTTPQGGIDDRP